MQRFPPRLVLLAAIAATACASGGIIAAAERPTPGDCAPGERAFTALGVCAARGADGCYVAALPGPERALAARRTGASPGRTRIRVLNRREVPLYFVARHGTATVEFALRVSGSDMALVTPEAEFCPTPCPARGAVMEVDCRAPIPALVVLSPAAVLTAQWSGELVVASARACDDRPPRACTTAVPAPAGVYRITLCAYPRASTGAKPGAAGTSTPLIERARPEGTPSCRTVEFTAPSPKPVELVFE